MEVIHCAVMHELETSKSPTSETRIHPLHKIHEYLLTTVSIAFKTTHEIENWMKQKAKLPFQVCQIPVLFTGKYIKHEGNN